MVTLHARVARLGRIGEAPGETLFGLYLGGLDEFYQGFVPGRERSLLDLCADLVGQMAGWYFSREDQTSGDAHGSAGHS